MTNDLTRRGFVVGSAALGATALSARVALADSHVVKVGFVYVGAIGDFGWTYAHDHARLAMQEHFGDKVESTFVENVAEGPDAERVIRQLAASGHELIFTTSFGFMNPTIRVAKQFPKVKFEHATGYQTSPNVAVYNARFHQGRAICGTIAGHISETGKIGYVASFPIPEVVMGINAIALWARRVRRDATVTVIWVNSWYDPGKEGDAAKAMIDQGIDIICQHTDSPAPLQVAEQRGVHGFGQASDMKTFAPRAQLTAILDDWGPYYIRRVQAVMDGTWKTENVWEGLKEGLVQMAPYGDAVPADVRADAERVRQGLIDGSLHTFEGPIKNQAGELIVAAGERMDDGAMASMDWYVEGVTA